MTESKGTPLVLTCQWCGTKFKRAHQHGRIPIFCSQNCRTRAHEDHKLRANIVGRLRRRAKRYEVANLYDSGYVAAMRDAADLIERRVV